MLILHVNCQFDSGNLCCILFICYSLIYLSLWFTENSKKSKIRNKRKLSSKVVLSKIAKKAKFGTSENYLSKSYFRYELSSFRILILASLLDLNYSIFRWSMWSFWMVVLRVNRDYYFTISRKKDFVKILAQSSIFSEFQIKVDFKVTNYHEDESLLIISCHIYLSTRKSIILFQVTIALPCILFLLNCPVIRYYWLIILRKRGNVKTLAWSSVFPSPQVKMKLKLTASR